MAYEIVHTRLGGDGARAAQGGSDNPHLAVCLENLAGVELAMARHVKPQDQAFFYDKARKNAVEAKKTSERVYGKEHPDVARALYLLGCILTPTDARSEAKQNLEEAKRIEEKVWAADHPQLAATLAAIAALEHSPSGMGKAIKMDEQLLGENHPTVAQLLFELASIYRKIGIPAKAEEPLNRCLKIREEALPPYHPELAEAYQLSAELRKDRDPDGAKTMEDRAAECRNAYDEADRDQ
jgi:tetratricopeptide (TPR) repeat protein